MDNDMDKLAQAALDAIKPRWRQLPRNVKDGLVMDVTAALTAASEPTPVEVEQEDEV